MVSFNVQLKSIPATETFKPILEDALANELKIKVLNMLMLEIETSAPKYAVTVTYEGNDAPLKPLIASPGFVKAMNRKLGINSVSIAKVEPNSIKTGILTTMLCFPFNLNILSLYVFNLNMFLILP